MTQRKSEVLMRTELGTILNSVGVLGTRAWNAELGGTGAVGYGPRGMEAGCGLWPFIVVAGEECMGSCGGHERNISCRSHGIPSEGFAGVDCQKGGGSQSAG